MTETFRLIFITDQNVKATLTIPHANGGVMPVEISNAMDAVISTNVLSFKNGKPVKKDSAERVRTEIEEIRITL